MHATKTFKMQQQTFYATTDYASRTRMRSNRVYLFATPMAHVTNITKNVRNKSLIVSNIHVYLHSFFLLFA